MIYYNIRVLHKISKKACGAESRGNQVPASRISSSSIREEGVDFPPVSCDIQVTCYQSFIRDSVPRIIIGAGHVGIPCMAHPQVLDSEWQQMSSINHIVRTNSLGLVSHAF